MRFASLGSGSRGNALLIEHGDSCVLVDCGFTLAETERRLARLEKSAEQLTAVLVTHEHADHVGGVGLLARKYSLPVWMTPGTWSPARFGDIPRLNFFSSHTPFTLGCLQIHPFPVPHDAREPAQFVFDDGRHRAGLLTDTGRSTAHIEEMLNRCDALLLECNHDPAMLTNGHYSASLKQRVGGPLGHLSNDQAAQLLARLDHSRLQHVVAMHLSEHNNTPQLACRALCEALRCTEEEVIVADQRAGLAWQVLA
ncbi:MAG: MBL fold metallo-hydrolase [Gammaproteobacteria bacterium]|nr:MBL fold metallo-hydrolase [Gammaproteobacteria bacterium]